MDPSWDPRIVEFWRSWRDWRGGRLMPLRTAVDPTRMPRLLPYVWMASRLDAGWRYRLAGEAVNLVHGRALRGRGPADILEAPTAAVAAARMDLMVSRPCGVYAVGLLPIRGGLAVPTERMTLPLADGDGVARHVIGLFLHTLRHVDRPRNDLWQQTVTELPLEAEWPGEPGSGLPASMMEGNARRAFPGEPDSGLPTSKMEGNARRAFPGAGAAD